MPPTWSTEARRAVAETPGSRPGSSSSGPANSSTSLYGARTLAVVVPIVVALIFLILYRTYHDLADAILMMLAVPARSPAGFLPVAAGLKLSVTVWVGYIACFGMATSTGIIMLVYLREAVAQAGGLERMGPRRTAARPF